MSPAFDINPSIDKDSLSLNIDYESGLLDIDLARSVGEYFMLDNTKMELIIKEVISAVSKWENIAQRIGIPRNEILLMQAAFRLI